MSFQSTVVPMHGALHVAEVAQITHVTPATVRYYTRIKLLNPKRNPENGYRYFSPEDVRRIEFIRHSQCLGLTISDVKKVLSKIDDGESPCDQVKLLVARRLQETRQKIADLRATENYASEMLSAWKKKGSETMAVADSGALCPLIERAMRESSNHPTQECKHASWR